MGTCYSGVWQSSKPIFYKPIPTEEVESLVRDPLDEYEVISSETIKKTSKPKHRTKIFWK